MCGREDLLCYLTLISENAISASAAAYFVHQTVAHEQLNEVEIDGGDFSPSKITTFDACFQLRLRKFRNAPSGRS